MENNLETTERCGYMSRGLMYFLAGSALGAGAALLFAPKPGSELRSDIASTAKTGYDGAVEMVNKVKDESTNLYHSIITKKNDLLDLAGSAMDETKDRISDAVETGIEETQEVRKAQASDAKSHPQVHSSDRQLRASGSGRRSSNIF